MGPPCTEKGVGSLGYGGGTGSGTGFVRWRWWTVFVFKHSVQTTWHETRATNCLPATRLSLGFHRRECRKVPPANRDRRRKTILTMEYLHPQISFREVPLIFTEWVVWPPGHPRRAIGQDLPGDKVQTVGPKKQRESLSCTFRACESLLWGI